MSELRIIKAGDKVIVADAQTRTVAQFYGKDREENAHLFAGAGALVVQVEAALAAMERADRETPWQENEPKWWLEMMQADRALRAALRACKGGA